jgi:serine/threonine-protein phosphatase 4 regulatory subunit 4
VAAAEAWATVARDTSMPAPDLAECLLPPALAALRDNRGDGRDVAEAWLGALRALLPALGREAVLREVLPLALSKGQVDESVASRVVCCRLLGAITPWLVRLVQPAFILGGLEHGHAFFASCVSAADRLSPTSNQPRPKQKREDVEAKYVTKVVALCQDTDYQVRVAACQQLAGLARCLGEEGLRQRQLLEEITQLLEDEEVQVRGWGRVVHERLHPGWC